MFIEETRKIRPRYLPFCPAVRDFKCNGTCEGREFLCQRCNNWKPWCYGSSGGQECNGCWNEVRTKFVALIKRYNGDRNLVFLTLQNDPLPRVRLETILAELIEEGSVVQLDELHFRAT